MNQKLEHTGSGDNVTGNKIQENNYGSKSDVTSLINMKVSQINMKEPLDLTNSKILEALKEVIIELIEEEQNKSHRMVPVGKVRIKFKNLFDDETFNSLIKQLQIENTIEIKETQICFLNNQTEYKVI